MLGIGFIITHFVAMEKPQQRKYHSSCNRSVHRGTAHGKQEVKVCKRKTPHLFLMRSFLSPYGGWYRSGMNGLETRTCFRPLTGMVLRRLRPYAPLLCFRPLTGMVLLQEGNYQYLSGFRPLTGMVQLYPWLQSSAEGFRPLTGRTLSVTAYAVPAPPKGGA